jgi:type III secretion protein J
MKKISICLLLACLLSGCQEQIIHNLSEADANKLVTRLHDIQIDGEKTKQADGKWAIAVPKGEEIRALQFIDDSRMLREPSPSFADKGSMISSRDDQRFKYERAISGEIESTIASIRGVLEARVHLNMPPTDPLFGQPLNNARGTASVLVVGSDGLALSEGEIANLVAGASGIPRESI